MKVYVSGPITGLPIDVARKAFTDAAAALATLGYEPVNPMDLPTEPDCACPGVTGTDGTGSGHEWACYLRKDIRVLVDCQAILMLPGWETSHGARLELTVASAIGLRVWWQMPAAPKLAQGGRRDVCGSACSEGHTYEAGCAIKPPARAFLGEPICGKPGCPCGGTR